MRSPHTPAGEWSLLSTTRERPTAAAAAAKLLQWCLTLCDPIRQQPTRFPHPWDSPGKNTGVGCHFLLQCMKVKSEREVAQSCPTFSDPMDCSPPGSSVHGIFQARVLERGAIAFSKRKAFTAMNNFFFLKKWNRRTSRDIWNHAFSFNMFYDVFESLIILLTGGKRLQDSNSYISFHQ